MNYPLEILIPTFNRSQDLEKNLGLLLAQITKDHMLEKVQISISDNHSTDMTPEVVASCQNNTKVKINYNRNDTNIGLEPNVVQLLKMAQSPYVLWLGDDDYLADGYLKYVIETIENQDIGVIITGLAALKADGSLINQRDQTIPEIDTNCGFKDMLTYSHLAHQMSGLVVKKEGLYDRYIAQPQWRNPYLFIFMAAECLLRHKGKYVPKYATKITDFNPKDWGYNKVGLLDEVFKSYLYFKEELGETQVVQLLLRFSVLHSYRYGISKTKPLQLMRQYRYLIISTPKLTGLKSKLGIQLIKEYLLSWMR